MWVRGGPRNREAGSEGEAVVQNWRRSIAGAGGGPLRRWTVNDSDQPDSDFCLTRC